MIEILHAPPPKLLGVTVCYSLLLYTDLFLISITGLSHPPEGFTTEQEEEDEAEEEEVDEMPDPPSLEPQTVPPPPSPPPPPPQVSILEILQRGENLRYVC